jgi:hypothetical protein
LLHAISELTAALDLLERCRGYVANVSSKIPDS